MTWNIEHRSLIEVNTDPQRRCYNGCHAKSELIWSNWLPLQPTTSIDADLRLFFWRDLNDYAISQRGESARKEFRKVETQTAT
jgi:hypothetical protein